MGIIKIFCILLLGLFFISYVGKFAEGFVMVSDSSGNTTNYLTHNNVTGGSSTFNGTTDASGNTSYDNYNHYTGTSSNSLINSGTVFYGPNGGRATVITGANGTQILKITYPNDPTPYTYDYVTVNQWQGPNGTATLVQSDGGSSLKISLNNGQTYVYTVNPPTGGDASDYNTVYIGSTGSPPPSNVMGATNTYNQQYYNQPPATATAGQYDQGSTGIPKSMIPPGQEDLYVLKSSIVPPVCPAPVVTQCPNTTPPPPCPPCARCPEPSFDCKKVPNYTAANTNLPVPVLADFSQFGL